MIDINKKNEITQLVPQCGNLGTAFRVINSMGVESYVIGSPHFSDEAGLRESCFHRIMEKCTTVYSEKGNYECVFSSQTSIPERDHQYRHVKYRFRFDAAILLEAFYRKIPVVALDLNNGLPEMDLGCQAILDVIDTHGVAGYEKAIMDCAEHIEKEDALLIEHIKRGSSELPRYRRDLLEPSDYERENCWVKILIPALKNTQTPICIVVGALHLFGKNGLGHRFLNEKMQVHKILSTSLSDQAQFGPPSEIAHRSFSLSPFLLSSLVQQSYRVDETACLTTQPVQKKSQVLGMEEYHAQEEPKDQRLEKQHSPCFDYSFDLLQGITFYHI